MDTIKLLKLLRSKEIVFKDVLAFIDSSYECKTSAFKNGLQNNAENENQGSARVLYFAKINNLSKEDTLELFAEHYNSVLANPDGNDHQNIRQFQINGWNTVSFEQEVLTAK